jgi:uncharacterized membrane protein
MVYFLLLAIATLFRFLPHMANFTPLGAVLIFTTYKYGYKQAIFLGLLAMIISDFIIGFSFASPFVYIGLLGYLAGAKLLKYKYSGYVLAPLSGSIIFFLVSNFGVWLGPWYTHTVDGLVRCFTLALPFYRNTLLGDFAFTWGLFATAFIVQKIYNKEKERGIWRNTSRGGISTKR